MYMCVGSSDFLLAHISKEANRSLEWYPEIEPAIAWNAPGKFEHQKIFLFFFTIIIVNG